MEALELEELELLAVGILGVEGELEELLGMPGDELGMLEGELLELELGEELEDELEEELDDELEEELEDELDVDWQLASTTTEMPRNIAAMGLLNTFILLDFMSFYL